MESLKKNKILLSVLGVSLLVVLIYFMFFNGNTPAADVAGDTTSSAVGSDILTMLNSINTVSIDTSVFSSSVWTSLRDLSASVPTIPPGRTDLFGSLSQAQSSASSNSNSNTKTTGAQSGSQ